MRCLGCDAEMRLVRVDRDHTQPVSGYAYHTFECPGCHDTETRLLFDRSPAEVTPEPSRSTAAEAPPPVPEDERAPPLGAWGRAIELLRSRQRALDERTATNGPPADQRASSPGAPPVLHSHPSDEPAVPERKPAIARLDDPPSSSKWGRAISMLRRMQERS